MEDGAARPLHLVSVVTSLLTCLVVLLHLLHPTLLGSPPPLTGAGQHAQRAAGMAGGPQHSMHSMDCKLAVADGWWQRMPPDAIIPELPPNVAVRNASDAFVVFNETLAYQWAWQPHPHCHIQRRSRAELGELLRGRHVAFFGDSHVRYFHNHLARALGGQEYAKVVGGDQRQHNKGQLLPALNLTMQVNMTHLASEVHEYVQTWSGPWPDLLVMDSSVWPLFTKVSIGRHTEEMQGLLHTLRTQVPPSVLLVWLSPPPRHTLKAPHYVDLPAEWIRMYNRVPVDLGFTYPYGPAFHLDLYTLAQDCLPWCSRDGIHVKDTVNEVALQILANLLLHLDSWPLT